MKRLYILIVILLILVVTIFVIGYVANKFNQSSPELISQENSFSNLKPMYGSASYEEYISTRSEQMRSADESFLNELVASDGSTKLAFQDAINQSME